MMGLLRSDGPKSYRPCFGRRLQLYLESDGTSRCHNLAHVTAEVREPAQVIPLQLHGVEAIEVVGAEIREVHVVVKQMKAMIRMLCATAIAAKAATAAVQETAAQRTHVT